jgi:hypothetical protein
LWRIKQTSVSLFQSDTSPRSEVHHPIDQTTDVARFKVRTTVLTIPVTDWGSWSWIGHTTNTVGYDWNVTKYRIGSVTTTTVHMSQNRVYLHFDIVSIRRHLSGEHDVKDNRTETRKSTTWLNNVFLEVATQDVSTYNRLAKTVNQIRFEDFQWPYSPNAWGAICGNYQSCRTILEGGLSPTLPFPTQIVERHPELDGCFVFSTYNGTYIVFQVYTGILTISRRSG